MAPSPARSSESPTGTDAPSRGGPLRDELKVCGLTAVRARFAREPGSILRLYFDRAMGQRIGVICKVLAQAKRIYRQVDPAELEKVAGTVHHGGIVAVVSAPRLREPTAATVRGWAERREPVLVLDRIGNPHNLGAIARTAAHFSVRQMVIPNDPKAARPVDAAFRVAEGGLEHVEVWMANDLCGVLRELSLAGYEVVGAATRGGRPEMGSRPALAGRPVALVLGNEEHGLAPEVAAACTRLVTVPGSGKVESLNVSAAAAVLLWEMVARRSDRRGGRPTDSGPSKGRPAPA